MSYPPATAHPWTRLKPRQILPIYPPPDTLLQPLPSLPCLPRTLNWPDWNLSTHVVPAAYIRSTPPVSISCPSTQQTKAERRAGNVALGTMLTNIRAEHQEREIATGNERVLWICVNRYVSTHPGGVTLLFTHANGFPKEIWEPVIRRILASSTSHNIAEIWTWESVQHGDSMLLNSAHKADGIYDWTDNARDILNFLLHYLPSSHDQLQPLPVHLPRIPSQEVSQRIAHGFSNRTLVTIGHSFGGCSAVLAALIHPALFSSLILLDPVITRPPDQKAGPNDLTLGALNRRDTWESREEALRTFSSNPFFAAWDSEMLSLYVECGLYEELNGKQVTLKTPRLQEAAVFADTQTPHVVWQEMSGLDERIELRWILPGKAGGASLGGPEAARVRAWRRPANSSNVRIANAGHLIPHEAPDQLVHEISTFLQGKYQPNESSKL